MISFIVCNTKQKKNFRAPFYFCANTCISCTYYSTISLIFFSLNSEIILQWKGNSYTVQYNCRITVQLYCGFLVRKTTYTCTSILQICSNYDVLSVKHTLFFHRSSGSVSVSLWCSCSACFNRLLTRRISSCNNNWSTISFKRDSCTRKKRTKSRMSL